MQGTHTACFCCATENSHIYDLSKINSITFKKVTLQPRYFLLKKGSKKINSGHFEYHDNLFITILSVLYFYYQLSPTQTTYMYLSICISATNYYSKPPVLPWPSSQHSTFTIRDQVSWMIAMWNRWVCWTFNSWASPIFCMPEVITLFGSTFMSLTHLISKYLKYVPVQTSQCQKR